MASPYGFFVSKVQDFRLNSLLCQLIRCYLSLMLFTSYLCTNAATQCIKRDVCSCVTDNMIVDLRAVSAVKNYVSPATAPSKFFFYNPCTPFDNKTGGLPGCIKTLLCQDDRSDKLHPVGLEEKVDFHGSPEDGNLWIYYEATEKTKEKTTTRKAHMDIICNKSAGTTASFAFLREDPTNTYTLEFHTALACPPSSGLSTGSVLVILFFVFLVLYLVGGVLFLRIARGAQGAELIPNREFWLDFPVLVRDGVYFVCRGCRAESRYEAI